VPNLIFKRKHALEAIQLSRTNGLEWLYANHPKPSGNMRKSSTGFLMHEGVSYPVKPLGRLANAIAGSPMTANPITNVFRRYFEALGFQLINSPKDEANEADERQKRLAKVWERPGQAKFRRAVFELFGARCLVTGCQTLMALEAAHIVSVADGGSDDGWNGIPLRADLHRLFDADVIQLDPASWKVYVIGTAREDYGQYHYLDIETVISRSDKAVELKTALFQRLKLRP
jgi:hypothetical protein